MNAQKLPLGLAWFSPGVAVPDMICGQHLRVPAANPSRKPQAH